MTSTFSTWSPECQCWIIFIFYLYQCIKDHWTTSENKFSHIWQNSVKIDCFIINFSWLGQCCTNSSIAFNPNIDQLRMYIYIYSNLLPHRRCFHNMLKENVEETLGLWIVTSLVTFIKSVNQSSIKPCLMLKETNV